VRGRTVFAEMSIWP